MLAGGVSIFLWKFVVAPTFGGVFAIYELLPAFIIGLLVIIVVSLCTKAPSKEIIAEFDAAKG
jgi:sodium/proline symporter